jgi:hypothetical protein
MDFLEGFYLKATNRMDHQSEKKNNKKKETKQELCN